MMTSFHLRNWCGHFRHFRHLHHVYVDTYPRP